MIKVQLRHLQSVLNAELIGADTEIVAVSTDTRAIDNNTLFIALIGERFDGHDFCQTAVDNGAKALLVSKPLALDIPQLVVADTHQALGQLGAWLKAKMTAEHSLKTLALTGSCGKTTVKEMAAAILATKGKVLATAGNFNNDIGVPLTLLRLTPADNYAVIELGANHLGEIAYTTALVKPDVALINNLAAAHLEGFGSLEGVAKAKGEIFAGLAAQGQAVINLDSNRVAMWQPSLTAHTVVSFSATTNNADYFASEIKINAQGLACFTMQTPVGAIDIQLTLAGTHNVSNALAAAALTMALGATLVDVKQGLETVTNVKGRLAITEPHSGLRLIDDTYNASVASVKAAIDVLHSFSGQRYFILGDMAELGEESESLHREVGEYARDKQFDCVMTFGRASAVVSDLNNGQHFSDKTALIDELKQQLHQQFSQHPTSQVTVLAKGARSSQMEDVIIALQEDK
ncbi:UDP-N-acetylmuramoyl-tripeptide--D-alanyl-D-alanine ligase [Photobacterium phosphoreum]|uniref:UDP-N-acetylmuramoyl-tripeptide--D-alanyl-D- alanine ligase n=1 Tax=Photobacterium phosphoreum TaxID=659 RepID=UPI000D159F60|nr:UDP-N-acetylmuramoyl-tripeptide--D-alanyl-D-alanine ligase [Photobacterium phosphoreum]PSU69564.1 UDP-N-acetylmuramoyl-tripeptide--D-alanyl-D-alanine ligase [Photobacterium phosphoreum]